MKEEALKLADRLEQYNFASMGLSAFIESADMIRKLVAELKYYQKHYLELVGNYQDLLLKEKFETPQTKPLSDEEIKEILSLDKCWIGEDCSIPNMMRFARLIEEKHGIK